MTCFFVLSSCLLLPDGNPVINNLITGSPSALCLGSDSRGHLGRNILELLMYYLKAK